MTPRILLASSCRWFATARLATAFAGAGGAVEAVCPPDHPVAKALAASRCHRFRALDPVGSIAAAIEASRPDLVIPCDDLATTCLHSLHDRARRLGQMGAATCGLIEDSLGASRSFPIVNARARLMALAQDLGIRVPPTAIVHTPDELAAWVGLHDLPAVLKVDGTFGGRGVRIANTLGEAVAAWQALNSAPSPARAIKRAIINGDANYLLPCLRRTRAVINVQRFVSGQDANSTVACWKGKVLASFHVIVLDTLDAHGPASVVRLIENREMSTAVEKIVSGLQLSGLVGFDFMIEGQTGDAYLIEMNPRATQMGHLALGAGRDLPAALCAVLAGGSQRPPSCVTDKDVIALFPQEWLRDPGSRFLSTAYHDVPWEQPELIRACLQDRPMQRLWTAVSARMHSADGLLGERGPRFDHSS